MLFVRAVRGNNSDCNALLIGVIQEPINVRLEIRRERFSFVPSDDHANSSKLTWSWTYLLDVFGMTVSASPGKIVMPSAGSLLRL